MTKRRLLEEERNSTWQISVQNVISSFLILILLFVSYSLISFNFYLVYFPGAAAEPLGNARGALRSPRSTGWEPLSYSVCCFICVLVLMQRPFLSVPTRRTNTC